MLTRSLTVFVVAGVVVLFGVKAWGGMLPKADFINVCDKECQVSPNRHKSNIKNETRPTDQCLLIKYYADMLYEKEEHRPGAELIFMDICPKTLKETK